MNHDLSFKLFVQNFEDLRRSLLLHMPTARGVTQQSPIAVVTTLTFAYCRDVTGIGAVNLAALPFTVCGLNL